MKNPNGYGSVYKLSGKRRKPWAISITTGRTPEGKPIRSIIGYAATRTEAMKMLAEYHEVPYDVSSSKLTFAEVYSLYKKDKFTADSNKNTVKNYDLAFYHAKPLHEKPMASIRLHDIQSVMDSYDSHDSAKRIMNLCTQMYDFCIHHEYLKNNVAKNAKVKQKAGEKQTKTIYTEEEINELWAHSDETSAQLILMLIYSGLRIGEFLALKKEDVHLDEHWFSVIASKTDNGIRDVPIHPRVYEFWVNSFERSTGEYAIVNNSGKKMSYDNFKRQYLYPWNEAHNQSHTCHECRHTFISRATVADVKDTYIKKMVGHTSLMSLTESVYTHITIDILLEAVSKVP